MTTIQRNKHPAGRISSMHFGLCNILDGLVRVLSFGLLHSTFALNQARESARKMMTKANRKLEQQ